MSRLGMVLGGLGSLLHRHGDLSPNLWDPRKNRSVAAHVCKPCGKREQDSRGSLARKPRQDLGSETDLVSRGKGR